MSKITLFILHVQILDIDECSNGNGKCQDGECINTPGSYSCECNEGFREDSRHMCRGLLVFLKLTLPM